MNKAVILLSILISLMYSCQKQEKKVEKPRYIVSKEEATLWIKATKLFKPLPEVKIKSKEDSAKVTVGKKLYYDTRLSKNGTQSCNTCHNLKNFGVDNEPTSLGDNGVTRGGRNSPTSLNAFLHIAQFWDGRSESVETQAQVPILNPIEMGMPSKAEVEKRIASVPEYVFLLKQSFPSDPNALSYEKLTSTIGAFERTLLTPSRFDKFLENDFEALNAKEKEGLKLFLEIGCATCHNGVAVGGSMYRKFGEKYSYMSYTGSKKMDLGRFEVTGNESDRQVFKVPSLRNVSKTAPYFHDGSVSDLKEAVKIMAKTQLDRDLSTKEIDSIVSFLSSLTGEVPSSAL